MKIKPKYKQIAEKFSAQGKLTTLNKKSTRRLDNSFSKGKLQVDEQFKRLIEAGTIKFFRV